MSATWPEITACVQKQGKQLKLSGKPLDARLAESNGNLEDAVVESMPAELTTMELRQSILCTLPPALGRLSQLTELVLSRNQLCTLPAELGSLKALKTLVAECNLISNLPDSIGQLSSLQTLDISTNRLTELPASTSNLVALQSLNASSNMLHCFPRAVFQLPKLSTCLLSHNKLEHMAHGAHKLAHLQQLELSSNQLAQLPCDIGQCTKLKTLRLDENPLQDKKLVKVVKEGKMKAILQHLAKFGAPAGAGEDEPQDHRVKGAGVQPETAAAKFAVLTPGPDDNHDVYVEPSVKGVRPHVVCVVLRALRLTPALYHRLLDIQTQLHHTVCDKRKAAAIGTHDMSGLQLPLTFKAMAPSEVQLVPLRRRPVAGSGTSHDAVPQDLAQLDVGAGPQSALFSKALEVSGAAAASGLFISADQLAQHFVGDATMLKYLSYIQQQEQYAVLVDRCGQVLSVPPVINNELSRLQEPGGDDGSGSGPGSGPGTMADNGSEAAAVTVCAPVSHGCVDVLVEVTSAVSQELCTEVMMQFLTQAADALAELGKGYGGSTGSGAEAGTACAAGPGPSPDRQLEVVQMKIRSLNGHVRLVYPPKQAAQK